MKYVIKNHSPKKRICSWLMFCMCLCANLFFVGSSVRASEDTFEYTSNYMLDEFDYQEIDECLKDLFPEDKLEFRQIVREVISGKTQLTCDLFLQLAADQFMYAFSSAKQNLIHIIALTLAAAICTSLSGAMKNHQVAESGFYILYNMILILCFRSAGVMLEWVKEGLHNLTRFMGVFDAIYFPAVAVAKGSFTATAFYSLTILLLSVMETLILYILLPMIRMYIILRLLNYLSKEDYLTKFSELIAVIVNWSLKTILACFIGLHLIQSLIHPAIDTVKRSVLARGVEVIPGIGDAIGGTTEVILATAVLVKNGIGVAGTIICFTLCSVPLLQIGIIVLVYKLAAAMLQPISDPRIVGCLDGVSMGMQMLMRVVFTVGVLFLFTIIIVAAVSTAV